MKWNKRYILILLFLFLALNLLLVTKMYFLRKDHQKSVFLQLNFEKYASNSRILLNQYKSNYIESLAFNIPPGVLKKIVSDRDNNSIKLQNLLSPYKSFVFLRIHDSFCNPCINKIMSRLDSFVSQSDRERILILVSFNNKKDFYKEINTYGFNFYFIDSLQPEIEFDNQQRPYFFAVYPDLSVRHGFIPIEDDLDFIQDYLNSVLPTNITKTDSHD